MSDSPVKIDVRRLNECRAFLRFVNSTPIERLVFVNDGVETPITEEVAAKWRVMGLPNSEFLTVKEQLAAVNGTKRKTRP